MEKEKLINWRNVHSPLMYDLARHIDGPPKYWDISIKELGEGSTKLERAKEFLKGLGMGEDQWMLVKIESEDGFEEWKRLLEDGKWNLSLRSEGFGLLFHKPNTERKNLILGGRLRFFNS